MTTSKKLSKSSGITIPKHIRLQLGWNPGMSVDMDTTEDGALLIRPHASYCRFCGAIKDVRKFKDICVCSKCTDEMKGAV